MKPFPAGAGRAVLDETETLFSLILASKPKKKCSGSSVLHLGWRAVAIAMPEIMPQVWEYRMLVVTRKVGERIKIGDIVITITHTGKSSAKIGIEAPEDVRIYREGILNRNPRTNPAPALRIK